MKETPRFIIHYHKTNKPHYDITLKKDGDERTWILPRGVPEKVSDIKIAVEKGPSEYKQKNPKQKDFYGEGELQTWDLGPFSINTENKIKYIFSADGKKFKGKYLLHNPSWGRWTKRKLWVLEKVPQK